MRRGAPLIYSLHLIRARKDLEGFDLLKKGRRDRVGQHLFQLFEARAFKRLDRRIVLAQHFFSFLADPIDFIEERTVHRL